MCSANCKTLLFEQVRHVPYSESQIITEYLLTIPSEGSVKDLFQEMENIINVPSQCMILGGGKKTYCSVFFSYMDKLSCIKENTSLRL